MEFLRDYVRNVGCFTVFSAVVRLIIPDGSFREYVDMFLGLMLMLVMINPFTGFIKTDLPNLKDYVLKNTVEAGQLLNEGGYKDMAAEEYEGYVEERISELCGGYVEGAEVTAVIGEDFEVSQIVIRGRAVGDVTELKGLLGGIFGTDEEKIVISEGGE